VQHGISVDEFQDAVVFANLEYCGALNLWISIGSACS
jgi:hypothetical protein